MLELMNELEEVWAQKINQAITEAQTAGRGDVAEYLSLKASNDAIRAESVKWLFDSLTEIAAFANRSQFSIAIENENPHQFEFQKANMVGAALRLRLGIRCLTLEAGWTRTPTDGFMRGGALAAAKISHFGMKKHNEDIVLLRSENFPQWFSIVSSEKKEVFNSIHLRKHFEIFTG